eukprot:GHUV01054343.1.p1 GENE.GHUV01054343.1~~GHUV01054343.1.p1  ORF type:complete len:115 (-),score=28.00 GHUV01054343.1:114-458(-)
MALGYIAAFSETLALAVIAEKGLAPLCAAVAEDTEDHLRAAAAWSLGQVGRHTPDHAKAVADTGKHQRCQSAKWQCSLGNCYTPSLEGLQQSGGVLSGVHTHLLQSTCKLPCFT